MSGPEVYLWSNVAWDIAKDNGMDEMQIAAMIEAPKTWESRDIDRDESQIGAGIKTQETGEFKDRDSEWADLEWACGPEIQLLARTKLSSCILTGLISGELQARDSNGQPIPRLLPNDFRGEGVFVHPTDVNEYLKKKNYLDAWTPREIQIEPTQAPLTREGIEKAMVITAFEGLHFPDRNGWKNALEDVPNWIKDSRVMRGIPGDKSQPGLWDPVLIALALHEKEIPIKKLDSVFKNILVAWEAKWKEKSDLLRL